jgi:glycosyltransferase involved in cell wall biosynthesis
LRLLHLGSGFRPWRRGGLVAYVEGLTQEQVRRGHEVTYLFSGRHYPYVSGPRLKRWTAGGVAMLEVINSPLYNHGRQPELELDEPRIERMLDGVIRKLRPDVVHVHELAGLPSSVLDVIRRSDVPAIVTLQDYFPLCSTFKLLDADGRVCLRREIGADCVATTAADPRPPGLLFEASLRYSLSRLPLVRRVDLALRDPPIRWVAGILARRAVAEAQAEQPDGGARATAFQRRRDVNVARLNGAHRLIAMSHRVAEIYSLLGVEPRRLSTLQLTLPHIEQLRPRRAEGRSPITFATLGGLESVAKGGRVLLDAVRSLSGAASAGRFRLLAFGVSDPDIAREAESVEGVELRGRYFPEQLDDLLEGVDVGILPSIWEEAYGYAGVEFLAKGIPVIANAIGGIVEYVRPGETGWLNRSRSADELAKIMLDVIEHPSQVGDLNANLRAAHESLVKPLARHADEMDAIYDEALAARRTTA